MLARYKLNILINFNSLYACLVVVVRAENSTDSLTIQRSPYIFSTVKTAISHQHSSTNKLFIGYVTHRI